MGNGFEKAPRFPKFLISISSRTLSRCVSFLEYERMFRFSIFVHNRSQWDRVTIVCDT